MKDADDFICVHCGAPVSAEAWGTKNRNHCPHCLHSRHMEIHPGDRACLCKGEMEPIAVWKKRDGELMLLHRCKQCGTIKANRCAGDDDVHAIAQLIPILDKSIS